MRSMINLPLTERFLEPKLLFELGENVEFTRVANEFSVFDKDYKSKLYLFVICHLYM